MSQLPLPTLSSTEQQEAANNRLLLPATDAEPAAVHPKPQAHQVQSAATRTEQPATHLELPAIRVELPASHYCFVPRQPNLLDALRSEGFDLPFQCRAGYCGRCRVQMCEGEVQYRQQPLAWINPGEILPCCCTATSDLTLRLPAAIIATGKWQEEP